MSAIVNEVLNPSFEAPVSVAHVEGGEGGRTESWAEYGKWSYEVRKTTSEGTIELYFAGTSPDSSWRPVSEGTLLTFAAFARAQAAGANCHARLVFANAAHEVLSSVTGTEGLDTGSGRRCSVTATVPATATLVREDLVWTAVPVSGVHFTDGWQVNEGELIEYADGSLAGYKWTGAPNESTTEVAGVGACAVGVRQRDRCAVGAAARDEAQTTLRVRDGVVASARRLDMVSVSVRG